MIIGKKRPPSPMKYKGFAVEALEGCVVDDDAQFLDAYPTHCRPGWRICVGASVSIKVRELADKLFLVAWRCRTNAFSAKLSWLVVTRRLLLHHALRSELPNTALDQECAPMTRRAVEPDPSDAVLKRLPVLHAIAALPNDDWEVLMLVTCDGLGPSDDRSGPRGYDGDRRGTAVPS